MRECKSDDIQSLSASGVVSPPKSIKNMQLFEGKLA